MNDLDARRRSDIDGDRDHTNGGITATGLVKSFTRQDRSVITPVDHIDLSVAPGEILALLGPSGCGKTTLLRCIAGLEVADDGVIHINERVVHDGSDRRRRVPVDKRNISMVFQNYALWPHLTAFANVAYPLRVRHLDRKTIDQRVREALEVTGISALSGQYPAQMSGGQQQRVALARAIVPGNGVILFDEPLSNVDAKVREQLRLEIVTMKERFGFSALYVTHDREEAMEVGDRLAVMKEGKIEQVGDPTAVYTRPSSLYVADFVGSVNELEGRIHGEDDTYFLVDTSLGRVDVAKVSTGDSVIRPGDDVTLCWRPETMEIESYRDTVPGKNSWSGRLTAALFGGPFTRQVITLTSGNSFEAWTVGKVKRRPGERVSVSISPEDIWIFKRATERH